MRVSSKVVSEKPKKVLDGWIWPVVQEELNDGSRPKKIRPV